MHLCFYTSTNNAGKKDATGAFIPGAKKFAEVNEGTILVPIDCSVAPTERLGQLVAGLKKYGGYLESITFFCHGLKRSIQHGLNVNNVRNNLMLRKLLTRTSNINLYACSTGADADKGFARVLCEVTKASVFSHTTPGHTYLNPKIRLFHSLWVLDSNVTVDDRLMATPGIAKRLATDEAFTFREVWKSHGR